MACQKFPCTTKFTPKVPSRVPELVDVKSDAPEDDEDAQNRKLLKRFKKVFGKGGPTGERKSVPVQVAFGYGNDTTSTRAFCHSRCSNISDLRTNSNLAMRKGGQVPAFHGGGNGLSKRMTGSADSGNRSSRIIKKGYIEPWDQLHMYPGIPPRRRSYWGDLELHNGEEFGEACMDYGMTHSVEIGLTEKTGKRDPLFHLTPALLGSMKPLPSPKGKEVVDDSKALAEKMCTREKDCSLEDLPAMEKSLVHESGATNMKLRDIILDDTSFADPVHVRRSIGMYDDGERTEGSHSVNKRISHEQSATDVPNRRINEHSCLVKSCSVKPIKSDARSSSRESSLQETIPNSHAIGLMEVDANAHNPPKHSTLSILPVKMKVVNNNFPINSSVDRMVGILNAGKQTVKSEYNDMEIEQLDHVSLQERLRLLTSSCHSSFIGDSKCSQISVTCVQEFDSCNSVDAKANGVTIGREENCTPMCSLVVAHEGVPFALEQDVSFGESSHLMNDVNVPSMGKIKNEHQLVDGQLIAQECYANNFYETNAVELFTTSVYSTENITKSDKTGSSNTHSSPRNSDHLENTLGKTQGTRSKCSRLTSLSEEPTYKLLNLALPSFPVKVKVENLLDGLICPENQLGNFSSAETLASKVKSEPDGESFADDLDHIPLQERLKMLVSSNSSSLDPFQHLKYLNEVVPSSLECAPNYSEKLRSGVIVQRKRKKTAMDVVEMEPVPCASESEPIDSTKTRCFTLRRRKKKTVTDSVEIALEEDAPGLLQVLVDKGINVDEIKLYGDAEDEDTPNMPADEDGFEELESVISKLFSQPFTLLKFAPSRNVKGSKVGYCLACLVSLIEQTHYLKFRKRPVEWGWCRDLQSFIFVFESHNRIVLERPEYGYATYFFELVKLLPIRWQIKRLVTALKLDSFSRATLIGNRALVVGEDLTEGEARVLEEYGWTRNSGLGTMLRYCDRVVHDKKSEFEKSESEWKSKIGRLLMDGYDGGSIVLSRVPERAIEYNGDQSQEIKLEV